MHRNLKYGYLILALFIKFLSSCASHDFGHSIGTEKINFNQRWSFHIGELDSAQG